MALNVIDEGFSRSFRPRLGEFDLGGVLYHANYFHLYEETREALLRQIGLPYNKLVEDNFHLAVVESSQEFIKPISYGQEVKVILSIQDITRSSAIFYYEIIDTRTADLLHEAWTKQVFVQRLDNGFKPRRWPEKLLGALQALSGE